MHQNVASDIKLIKIAPLQLLDIAIVFAFGIPAKESEAGESEVEHFLPAGEAEESEAGESKVEHFVPAGEAEESGHLVTEGEAEESEHFVASEES